MRLFTTYSHTSTLRGLRSLKENAKENTITRVIGLLKRGALRSMRLRPKSHVRATPSYNTGVGVARRCLTLQPLAGAYVALVHALFCDGLGNTNIDGNVRIVSMLA